METVFVHSLPSESLAYLLPPFTAAEVLSSPRSQRITQERRLTWFGDGRLTHSLEGLLRLSCLAHILSIKRKMCL